jgi:tRNA-2-methylthio-N6-dimethylallyladenosine synthase
MGRGYTRETYLVLAHRLREARPEIAISSDVMVGFPGESEGDFQETLDLIQAVRFDMLFSFKYSDREGTVAYHMGPKVEETEKARRLERLQALQRQITLESNRAAEGKELEVLVEGESRKGAQLTGRTSTNKTVNFTGNSKMIGNLIKVKIKRGNTNSLWGELPSHP